jgi:hypothetical protein
VVRAPPMSSAWTRTEKEKPALPSPPPHGTPSPPAGFEALTHLIAWLFHLFFQKHILYIIWPIKTKISACWAMCRHVLELHATCYMHMHEEMSPRLQPYN